MNISLYDHISRLCPTMSSTEVDYAIEILTGKMPLVPHGKLKTANYDYPIIGLNSPLKYNLHALNSYFATLCTTNSYDAIASTQVGLHIPFVYFSKFHGVIIQRPRLAILSDDTVYGLEGCGSLPPKSAYITLYNRKVRIAYHYYDDEFVEDHTLTPWFTRTLSFIHKLDLQHYIHEYRHLWGRTAVDIRIVHPNSLSRQSWQGFVASFDTFHAKEYKAQVYNSLKHRDNPKELLCRQLQNRGFTQLLVPFPIIGGYHAIPVERI